MIVFLIQLLLCVAEASTYNTPREATTTADVGHRAYKVRVWSRVYNQQSKAG